MSSYNRFYAHMLRLTADSTVIDTHRRKVDEYVAARRSGDTWRELKALQELDASFDQLKRRTGRD